MADSRKLGRFVAGVVAGVVAVTLLGAAQPPGSAPPLAPVSPPTPGEVALPPAPPVAQPGPSLLPPAIGQPTPAPPGPRFNLKIDPKATAKDLLPPAPKVSPIRGPVTVDDLKAIPEIEFEARPAKDAPHEKLVGAAAHQIAKINHVNAKKTDAFMTALLEHRPDLGGMPFAMGDDCRTSGDKLKHFTQAVSTVRQALGNRGDNRQIFTFSTGVFGGPQAPANVPAVQQAGASQPFWPQYTMLCEQQDVAFRADKETAEHVTAARVAALMQMLAAEPAETRLGLVKYLAGVSHVEATKALARTAIYSAENDVRDAALTALKVRREKDYTDVLLKGLRYPWPAVAKRSAEAIAKLERTDLVPELLAALDATDPRLPTVKEEGGKKVASVREMVKLNHHRNCLMCHAPAGSGTPNPNALTVEVAVQGQPLPSPSEGGYRQSTPELMIRLDVTYLRQDFSAALPVEEAHPWPEAQRFDFFVRERKLTEDEAAAYRDKLTPKEEGVLSPYHKAAVAALREMTGKDAAPTVAAWRKLLNVPK